MAWRRELGCSLCIPLETSLCPDERIMAEVVVATKRRRRS